SRAGRAARAPSLRQIGDGPRHATTFRATDAACSKHTRLRGLLSCAPEPGHSDAPTTASAWRLARCLGSGRPRRFILAGSESLYRFLTPREFETSDWGVVGTGFAPGWDCEHAFAQ